jgi:hypothetical protein
LRAAEYRFRNEGLAGELGVAVLRRAVSRAEPRWSGRSLRCHPNRESFFIEQLGNEFGDWISHCETHHYRPDDDPQPVETRGRVRFITAVYWARASQPGEDPRAQYPVPGTSVLETRDSADGWEPEDDDGPRLEGYIVELTPL